MGKFTGLIILDGYGLNKEGENNAISKATSPYILDLMKKYPTTSLDASGMAVGLPDGQMGNSEVGHLNIGAGRIVYQELTRITKSINDGDFFENEAFLKACKNAKENGKKLHIFGLLSDGGVHSHISHIFALFDLAKKQGLDNVYLHAFLDGRDVSPTSGKQFIIDTAEYIKKIGFGEIATISGRFYAMDRDNIWERVEKAYSAIVDGVGNSANSAVEAITTSYENGVTDEFVIPTIIEKNGKPVATIDKGDSIIFANFRPDRARMITRSFIYSDFNSFERKKGFLAPTFVSMTQYDVTFNDALDVAYKPQSYNNTLGEYLSKQGLKQFRIAETQKYAHVTFFFNGGVEAPNPNEDRILIDSPKIATFDMKPEMSAYEVADKAVEVILSKKYDVMILNFANCDMVGHTGILDAAKKAVKAVDECVEKVLNAIRKVGGQALITADHGNADYMYDLETKEPFTAHTTNPVPLIKINEDTDTQLMAGGKLCDIAPTMLEMMGIEIPAEMSGHSLLKK
ncbi:MAG: 2,3-bisphosphoglycerate-independent phosphoglycerate mutase [Clostridia bacterium]|nr:2,3-bisphosphoglycerate-independent phosphoglycerate mutase [Clostridia bacterium]